MALIPYPKGSNALPNMPAPVLDRERRPTVDSRAVQQGVARLGSVKAPELPEELANNSGMVAIGRAVAQTGNVATALGLKLQEAQTDIQVAEADLGFQNEAAGFVDWQTKNPDPSTWKPERDRRIAELEKGLLSKEGLTPQAQERITLLAMKRKGEALAGTEVAAAKQTFALARDAFNANFENAVYTQNRPAAEEAVNAMVSKGYIVAEEGKTMLLKYDEEEKRMQKQAAAEMDAIEFDNGSRDAIRDPKAWLEENKEPWAGKEQIWQRVKNVADAREREGTAEALNLLQDAISTGDLTVPAQIDAWESPFLTPALREQAKRHLMQHDAAALAADREANGVKNAVLFRKRVADYDPSKDPERTEYFELVRGISDHVDGGMVNELSNELAKKYGTKAPDSKVRPEIQQNVSKTLDGIFDPKAGAIPWKREQPVLLPNGKPEKDTKGRIKTETVEDPVAKQRAIDAQTVIEIKMGDWFKENPEATLPEVKKKLNELIPEGTRMGALDSLQKIMPKRDSAALGRVTSYGYANDSTPDRNSSAGIGAFVPEAEQEKIKRGEPSNYRLREGDIAVSPDVEKAFKAAGVRPMDEVLVTLANGETKRARWMDRTAQDSQILRGEIKGVRQPLRGRFDFYSPGGVSPFDGLAVTGWQPIRNVAQR